MAAHRDKSIPPDNPGDLPAPGSLPKLPKTIFNYENDGRSSPGEWLRRTLRRYRIRRSPK